MFNQLFNSKTGEDLFDQLRGIVQNSQLNGRDLPITVYAKGIVVTGYAISFPAYKLKAIEEAIKRQPEMKSQLLAMSDKYQKEAEFVKAGESIQIMVIRDAEVHYGGVSHRTSHWIGNIDSIDAFEETISGRRPSDQSNSGQE